MAIDNIIIGTTPNDKTGDNLRDGAIKINANFNELDSRFNTTLVSGSSQLTGSLDLRYTLSGSISPLPDGIVSGSDQLSGSFVNLDGDVMTGGLVTPSLSASYVDLHVDGIPAYKEGRIFYDTVTGAFSVFNDQPDVTLQLGQEMYIKTINKSGVNILNGTPVLISGSQGDQSKIWTATSTIVDQYHTGNHIIGVATHDILDNESGYVTTQGLVNDLDTSQWVGGTELYLSSSFGELTSIAEQYPYERVFVGFVIRQHASVGSIYVKPLEPIHFNDISGISGDGSVQYDIWVKDADGGWRARHDNLVLSGSFNGTLNSNMIPPTSISGSGTQGEIRTDTDYIYVCITTDTWKRSPLSDW